MPSKFANLFSSYCLYLFGTWVPAAAIFFSDYWLLRNLHFRVFPNLPLIVLDSGVFAPGAVVYLAIRSSRETGRMRRGFVSLGVSTVLKVLAAESISAFLFCIGIAVFGAFSCGGDHEGELVAAVITYAVSLLLLSLLTGAISGTFGYVIGMAMGANFQGQGGSGDQGPLHIGRTAWSISGITLSVAVFSALDVAALLWTPYGNIGSVPSPGIREWLLAFAASLLGLVLVGNLWACVVALGIPCLSLPSGWRKWSGLALLLGLAAFGVWCVHFYDFALWFSTFGLNV